MRAWARSSAQGGGENRKGKQTCHLINVHSQEGKDVSFVNREGFYSAQCMSLHARVGYDFSCAAPFVLKKTRLTLSIEA